MITVFDGWVVSKLGDAAYGMLRIREALRQYRMTGNGIQLVWMFAMLAEAEWEAGACNDAFNTLAEAMKLAAENGEGLFEPEVYRLKGQFLFAQAIGAGGSRFAANNDCESQLAEAERCMGNAVAIARRQEAKMLELRALVGLCRLHSEAGIAPGARDELEGVYQQFTEGFDSPDLREARTILAALKA
jgi:predicted ATPase